MRLKAFFMAFALCVGPLASGAAPAEVTVDEEVDAAERQGHNRGRFPASGSWEVTITPPSAPGEEPDDTGPTDARPAGQAGSVGFPGQQWQSDAPEAGEDNASRGADGATNEQNASQDGAAAPARRSPGSDAEQSPGASPAAPGLDSDAGGPRQGFQVGAYRSKQRALDLEAKLSATFSDVYLTRINSGGEPLYRVRVGRLRNQSTAIELGTRLKKAGYAAFPVSEPGGN